MQTKGTSLTGECPLLFYYIYAVNNLTSIKVRQNFFLVYRSSQRNNHTYEEIVKERFMRIKNMQKV